MNDQNVELVRNREPFEGTCDVCAGESGALIVHVDPDTEAYVCATCWEDEEAAILAGAQALRQHWERQDAMSLEECCARVVIAAYWAHKSPSELIGGSV